MKENRYWGVNRRLAVSAAAALAIAGCGGGSSGTSGASSSTTSALSSVQQNYESVALASNGGIHYPQSVLEASTSETGALTVDSSSFFYTQDVSPAQSPASGVQSVAMTYTSVANTLAVPAITAARYMVNGTVVSRQVPDSLQISYSGGNVQQVYLATDGKTVARTLLGTSYTVVPLSGLIANSPSELFANSAVGIITDTLNGQSLYNQAANWQAGAAYVRVAMQELGDTLVAGDCAAPMTTGPNPTPCSTSASTLETFFPYTDATGVTYQLSGGQVVTLAGVRAWVSNTPVSGEATTQYEVFYQNNGTIYTGHLVKDGTSLQYYPSGSQTPQAGYIFLNGAAVQSLKAAVNF